MINDIEDTKLDLQEILRSVNVAKDLTENELNNIGQKVIHEMGIDEGSRSKWKKQADEILKLAKLTIERKDSPHPGSANIKYPLITSAILQYAARLYPEIIRDDNLIGFAVLGEDPTGEIEARAKRLADYMTYQCLDESPDWEEYMDRAINVCLAIGVGWKKIWYNPIQKRNISEFCGHDEIVINDHIASLAQALRISHKLKMSTKDIIENIRAGLFLKIELEELRANLVDDEDFHEVVEQHRFLDLDDDGYPEPYIVTVLTSGQNHKVLRIVARFEQEDITYNEDEEVVRIAATQHFEDIHCLRSPDGKYHSYGLGTILLHGNKTINSLLNILVDAGKNSSLQTKVVGDNIKIPGGLQNITPGTIYQAKSLDGRALADSVVDIEFKEPSPVLFEMLQLMIASNKELSTLTDTLLGQGQTQNVTATTISVLQQESKKIYSSIERRLLDSLTSEAKKLMHLNWLYLDESKYYRGKNGLQVVYKDDFNPKHTDVCPTADMNRSNETTKSMKAQALIQLIQLQIPGLNVPEVLKRVLTALNEENIDALIQQDKPLPPDPKVLKVQQDDKKHQDTMKLAAAELLLKKQETEMKAAKTQAEIMSMKVDAAANMGKLSIDKERAKAELMDMHEDRQQQTIDNAHRLHELALAHKIADKKEVND